MSGIAAKWAVRRYQPAPPYEQFGMEGAVETLHPGAAEQTFDTWPEVCEAARTIIGVNDLKPDIQPSDPVVIKHGDDIVLIFVKLVFGP